MRKNFNPKTFSCLHLMLSNYSILNLCNLLSLTHLFIFLYKNELAESTLCYLIEKHHKVRDVNINKII